MMMMMGFGLAHVHILPIKTIKFKQTLYFRESMSQTFTLVYILRCMGNSLP